MSFDLFLTPKEAADLLGLSIPGILKACKQNSIETQKHSTKRKIYPQEFRSLLETRGCEIPKKKIAIHNLKGGVGKTTLANALGTRASTFGLRTLLVDADKQGNLTSSFGINPDKMAIRTLQDMFTDVYVHSRAPENTIISITDNLDLLPANLELANLDIGIQSKTPDIRNLINRLIGEFENDYELIIFDLAPDFNRLTLAIHAYIDLALIPVSLGEFALQGVDLTYKHINYASKEYQRNIEKKVVINRFDARNSLDLAKTLSNKYSDDLCPVVIPVASTLEKAFINKINMWTMQRSKVPALDGFDATLSHILNLEKHWKHGDLSKKNNLAKRREYEEQEAKA